MVYSRSGSQHQKMRNNQLPNFSNENVPLLCMKHLPASSKTKGIHTKIHSFEFLELQAQMLTKTNLPYIAFICESEIIDKNDENVFSLHVPTSVFCQHLTSKLDIEFCAALLSLPLLQCHSKINKKQLQLKNTIYLLSKDARRTFRFRPPRYRCFLFGSLVSPAMSRWHMRAFFEL